MILDILTAGGLIFNVAILTKVFFMVGKITATLDGQERRIEALEARV